MVKTNDCNFFQNGDNIMIKGLLSKPIGKVLVIILSILIIAGAVFILYIFRTRTIRIIGTTLTPKKDHDIHEVQYFLQNDPAWAQDSIGSSNYKMGGAGCLITCVASSISDLGVAITPQELNQKLTAIDGYQNGADLIWYKINEAVPEVDYYYSRVFSSETIEKDLDKGLLPIVKVKFHGFGAQHWLLIVGAQDGEFMVLDPLNSEKKVIPLSTHGRAYAYRVLNRANG